MANGRKDKQYYIAFFSPPRHQYGYVDVYTYAPNGKWKKGPQTKGLIRIFFFSIAVVLFCVCAAVVSVDEEGEAKREPRSNAQQSKMLSRARTQQVKKIHIKIESIVCSPFWFTFVITFNISSVCICTTIDAPCVRKFFFFFSSTVCSLVVTIVAITVVVIVNFFGLFFVSMFSVCYSTHFCLIWSFEISFRERWRRSID